MVSNEDVLLLKYQAFFRITFKLRPTVKKQMIRKAVVLVPRCYITVIFCYGALNKNGMHI